MADTNINNPYAIHNVNVSVNTDVVDSYSLIKCVIVSGICFVNIQGLKLKNSGDNLTILTGLPKAIVQSGSRPAGNNGSNTALINSAGSHFYIEMNQTTLRAHIGANDQSRAHWATVIYPTSD